MNNVVSVTPAVRTPTDDGLGIPDFCRRAPGEKPAPVVLRTVAKVPYAGKETPEETAALKAPPVTRELLYRGHVAGAMRKALKNSSAPKVAPKAAAIAKPAKVAKATATKGYDPNKPTSISWSEMTGADLPPAKKKPAKVAKAAKKAPKAKAKPAANGKTKLELITALLLRKCGCTNADVLEVTNWPSVSMPQQATAAGLKLRKEKKPGSPTRYFGEKK